MLHLALKAFHPAQAAVPAAARRHDLEVPRHVRVPRPDGGGARARAARAHQPGGLGDGHQPVRPRLGRPHRRVEDRGAQAGARRSTASTRPSAARGATRRSRAPRSASSRSARRSTAGTRRTSGPSCGGSTTRASAAARRSASSRSRTGPSSTSGSTSTSRRSRSCRSTSPRERPVVERDGTLIMVDDDRMPLEPGEQPRA